MASVGCFILLALLAVARGGVIQNGTQHTRIVNGQLVTEGEIPHQVALYAKRSSIGPTLLCGGSILNKNYVLTAAHCVVGFLIKDIVIFAGTLDYTDPKYIHDASKIMYHKDYVEKNSWINDIALIKVATPFKFSKTVQSIKLPQPNAHFKAGKAAVVSGWGKIYEEGPISKYLQRAEIEIVDQGLCRRLYQGSNQVHDSQICAHDPSKVQGSCQGDSGGPLTVDGILVGIVSWSRGCGSVIYPAVFTRVSSYIDWIRFNAV